MINFKVQANGKYKESLDKANRLMIYAEKQSDAAIPDKKALISNIHSNIGNARLELGDYDSALKSHNSDLDISREMYDK